MLKDSISTMPATERFKLASFIYDQKEQERRDWDAREHKLCTVYYF